MHMYRLSASRPLPGHSVQLFLETRAAVIFRRMNDGKFVSVGGAIMLPILRACLSLLTKAPDHPILGMLQDGLLSGVKAREGGDNTLLKQARSGKRKRGAKYFEFHSSDLDKHISSSDNFSTFSSHNS